MSKKRARLIRHMEKFAREVKASDCADLKGDPREKTQYTHSHKALKLKGGHPPRDYTAVELLIDFKIEMNKENYDQAIPLYFQLIRLLKWAD
jgi:hypothetical protein